MRLFAAHRQIAGSREVRIELPDGATIADSWTALVALHPGLDRGTTSVRFALNGKYADRTTVLADDDEVACIPPVAGGAGHEEVPPSEALLSITSDPIDQALLGRLAQDVATPADGAVVSFVGRTRESPGTPAPGEEAEAARHAGQLVESLDYEAFEEMALAVFGEIAGEIRRRFGVDRLAIVHRTGSVPVGEPSVAIVVAAAHRDAAFRACWYAIDELKARAPIWKSERFADGSVWLGAPARHGPTETRD